MFAAPLNYLAMEAGWVTREVGRQPYVVYGVLRTSDSASPLPVWVGSSLFIFAIFYLMLFVAFLVFARLIIARGPARK
jgi:cytochrome d ubiquinol oxidase subunit I